MLSRELRIGNYVNSPIEFFNDSVLHTIRAEDIVEQSNCEKIGKAWFEPIPLTDKWIKDFGFDSDVFYKFDESGIEMNTISMLWYRLNSVQFIYIDNIYKITLFDIEIKYVHELQNLYFALTKNELTIK